MLHHLVRGLIVGIARNARNARKEFLQDMASYIAMGAGIAFVLVMLAISGR